MEQQSWAIGVDIGGTNIKAGLVSSQGEIAFQLEEPTYHSEDQEKMLQQIEQIVQICLEQAGTNQVIQGIGLGIPAFLNPLTGYVYHAPNLGWTNFALKEALVRRLPLPVYLDNDANVAALGEGCFGAGQGVSDLLCITLGTGVGGGILIDGQIYHGKLGMAGEIGHVTVTAQGAPCNCGKKGCLETVASATGLVRLATEGLQASGKISKLSQIIQEQGSLAAKDVALAAQQGDELAVQTLDLATNYLGVVLANITLVLNPERIIIGGGVAKAGEVLFKPLRQHFREHLSPSLRDKIEIVPAKLGKFAGMLGAACLNFQKA